MSQIRAMWHLNEGFQVAQDFFSGTPTVPHVNTKSTYKSVPDVSSVTNITAWFQHLAGRSPGPLSALIPRPAFINTKMWVSFFQRISDELMTIMVGMWAVMKVATRLRWGLISRGSDHIKPSCATKTHFVFEK